MSDHIKQIKLPNGKTHDLAVDITAAASDDGIVVLSGTNGENKVTYRATHATNGLSSDYTTGDSTAKISGSGGKGTIKIPQLTVDTYGHVIPDVDQSVRIELPTIPSAIKNPEPLVIGTKSYDGENRIEIVAEDLGLSSAMKFIGTATTAISDGATTNPITISGKSVTVTNGNVVIYGQKEFIWNGSAWEEFGNEGNYKRVQGAIASPSASGTATSFIDTISQNAQGVIAATKKTIPTVTQSAEGLMIPGDKEKLDKIPLDHVHKVTHKPAGTVSQPTFTGSEVTSGSASGTVPVPSTSHTHTVTAKGTLSQPVFAGKEADLVFTYTPGGSVSQPSFTGSSATTGGPSGSAVEVATSAHTHAYTPEGTITKPTFSGTAVNSGKPDTTNKTTIYSITGVGSLPSATLNKGSLQSLSGSVSGRCLTLSLSGGALPSLSFSAGALPTRSGAISMPNTNHTHSVTAAGTVSTPVFEGTPATIGSVTGKVNVANSGHTHNVTAKGSVSKPSFTGTEKNVTITYTPEGTVSTPTFTGDSVATSGPTGTTNVPSTGHTHKVTASGTVSKPTFTGTSATLTTGTPVSTD